MNKAEVLIIDDETQIQRLIQINLEESGYKVHQAYTGKEGIMLAANHSPDVILLDLGLPDMEGHQLLKELRIWYKKAIIVLSVRNGENDIITALDNGATDYLTKPFRVGELMARIRSAINRYNPEESHQRMTFDELEIDLPARILKRKGELVRLTPTEYRLLALLVNNEGRVLTHQFILKEIWGVGFQTETQYLRVFVAQLRKKIEENPDNPKHIITESGIGYRFQ
ncbi:DNA-binding response regulator [Bacteroidia bacterium]|nr:DNA-binding response regulator [Bacteroidia bacterium]